MIFDSHAHVISEDFDRYPASPLSGKLDRRLDDPMTAERLIREMDAARVRHAVLVQRAHVYGYDNRYVCYLGATRTHCRKGFVARSIEEGDLFARSSGYLVSAYMLRDTTCLTCHYICTAHIVQQ